MYHYDFAEESIYSFRISRVGSQEPFFFVKFGYSVASLGPSSETAEKNLGTKILKDGGGRIELNICSNNVYKSTPQWCK